MKRVLLPLLLVACRGSSRTSAPAPAPIPTMDAVSPAPVAPKADATALPSTPIELTRLCSMYACTPGSDPSATRAVRLPDGTILPWDDRKTKTTAERIADPDVEDIFALGYPAPGTAIAPVRDPEVDPGRVRVEALFRATYGADARAVSAAMVPVKFMGHTVGFHGLAAPALGRVAKRLDSLAADPELKRYFRNLGGTFHSRNIAGTDRASAHSWAIAIDIDTSMADYWRNGPQPPTWKNRIPQVIVDAFEAEGFVWGGRWFHYDTMHFEYRPELFEGREAARDTGPSPGSGDSH